MLNFENSRSGLNLYVLAIPLVLFVLLALSSPLFLQPENLSNLSSQMAALVVVAFAQLLVALVAGIDLSVGSVISLTTCVIAAGGGSSWSIGTALVLGCLVGFFNGMAVTKLRIHPIIVTLSSMTFVQGLALSILPAPGGELPPFLTRLVNGNIVANIPNSLVLIVICLIAVSWLLQRTRLGLRIHAVGANPMNGYLNGLRDQRIIQSAYVLSSLLAVISGIALAGRIGSGDPTIGAPFTLTSVTAVALGGVQFGGGIGSAVGALAGVLTLGFIRNGMNLFGVSAFLQSAITGLILLVAIGFQRRSVVGF